MVGWHHQLNGHESAQTLEDSEGQLSLACCSPWSEITATEQEQEGTGIPEATRQGKKKGI